MFDSPNLATTERSPAALLGTTARLVGFGLADVADKFHCVLLLETGHDEWILCMLEAPGKSDPLPWRPLLGQQLAGENFAPYAHRWFGNLEYARLKDAVERGMRVKFFDMVFEWVR